MSFFVCFPNPYTSACLSEYFWWVMSLSTVIPIWIITRFVMKAFDAAFDAASDSVEKTFDRAKVRHQRLLKIDGAESWSLDDVELRIFQLDRLLNPKNVSISTAFVLNPSNREDIEDTIFKLDRIAQRKRKNENDTSPDTIIGYERD